MKFNDPKEMPFFVKSVVILIIFLSLLGTAAHLLTAYTVPFLLVIIVTVILVYPKS
jgi:hypothetical protein